MTSSAERKQRRFNRFTELEKQLHEARLEAWSARRGLIAYMDEHGLGERVNKEVRRQIEAGPPVAPESLR